MSAPELLKLAGHDGLALAASARGPADGPRVLLAHGGGQTRRAWRRVAEVLGDQGFRAVALDLRGHGESAWAPDGAYSTEDFAGDLIAVARQIGGRPAMVGASLGGIAAMLAEGELAPGSFASLTLVDVTPRLEPEGVAKITGFMAKHMESGFASPAEAAEAIGTYTANRERRGPSDTLSHYLREGSDGRFRWHWDPRFISGKGPRPSDQVERLERAVGAIRVPVQLVRGKASDLVSPEAVDAFRALAPKARFDDIAGAGHMVVGDKNDAFADAIIDFLKGVRAPA